MGGDSHSALYAALPFVYLIHNDLMCMAQLALVVHTAWKRAGTVDYCKGRYTLYVE